MKSYKKRILSTVLVLIMVLGLATACGEKQAETGEAGDGGPQAASKSMTVRISAGPSGANNFMICAALGDKVSSVFPNYTISAEISTGSAQNIRAMSQNEAQMGIAMSDSAILSRSSLTMLLGAIRRLFT